MSLAMQQLFFVLSSVLNQADGYFCCAVCSATPSCVEFGAGRNGSRASRGREAQMKGFVDECCLYVSIHPAGGNNTGQTQRC